MFTDLDWLFVVVISYRTIIRNAGNRQTATWKLSMLISSNDYQKGVFTVRLIISRSCQSFFFYHRGFLYSRTLCSLCERVNPSGMSHSTVHKPNKAANYRPSKTPFFFIHSSFFFVQFFSSMHIRIKKGIFSNKEEELPYLEKKRLLEMHNSETDDGPVCF